MTSALRKLCGVTKTAAPGDYTLAKLAAGPVFSGTSLTGNVTALGNKVMGAAGVAARSVGGAAKDVGTAIGNRTRRWSNPFAYGAVRQSDTLDKKIDEYNRRQWAKNPDPTSDAPVYVNRGSTFSRNGRPLRLNLKGLPDVSHATAIDVLDAWHRDPETTHLPPPSIGRAPSFVNENTGMGIPNPFGRGNVGHVWLPPSADTSMLIHEAGHNRRHPIFRQGVG